MAFSSSHLSLTFAFVAIAAALGISASIIFFPDAYRSSFLLQLQNDGSGVAHLHNLSTGHRLGFDHDWPKLALDWRTVIGTLGAIFGAACGSVGGVGGGAIFVPLLLLVIGFDTKTTPSLSKCMIMGQSLSTVWFNVRLKHPDTNLPLIDYDMALIFQPMLLVGISMGVIFNVMFPSWLTTLLFIILSVVISSRALYRAFTLWNVETFQMERRKGDIKQPLINANQRDSEDGKVGTDVADSLCANIRWRPFLVLWLVWISFLVLQNLKASSLECSLQFWIYNILQIPISIGVATYASIHLYKEGKKKPFSATEDISTSQPKDKISRFILYMFSGMLAGIVGGLLGLGGGAIIGPLLLELGQPPQAAAATAIFIMMFSSSMSVVEYYLLGMFPIPYAVYLTLVSIFSAIWGQYLVRKAVKMMGRDSIIVFILAFVILFGSFTLGGVGIADAISDFKRGKYMGISDICTS